MVRAVEGGGGHPSSRCQRGRGVRLPRRLKSALLPAEGESAPRPRHEVMLPGDAPFWNLASETFTFTRTMMVDDAAKWLGTYSGLIMAPDEERAAVLAHAREAVLRQADAAGLVQIPMRSACWRADRADRKS